MYRQRFGIRYQIAKKTEDIANRMIIEVYNYYKKKLGEGVNFELTDSVFDFYKC